MKKTLNVDPYKEYRLHSVDNEIEIVKSQRCGCYFCHSIFSARSVKDWLSDERGVSAICPECGMDTVLGDASGIQIDKQLLKNMSKQYFGDEVSLEAARAYCIRYLDSKINKTEHNEYLYEEYLKKLALSGDAPATLALSKLYQGEGSFVKEDDPKALSYLESPLLSTNTVALTDMAALYFHGDLGLEQAEAYKKGFECLTKASALGSLKAVYLLSDLYLQGIYVEKDLYFAYKLLDENYKDVYDTFAYERKGCNDFLQFNYRLGKIYEYGVGTDKDQMKSMRCFLLSLLALSYPATVDPIDPEAGKIIKEDIEKEVKALAAAMHLSNASPIYDQDTYFDSFADVGEDYSPKALKVVSWNKEEGKLSFDVDYKLTPIIVDIAGLYCGFVSGSIRWDFDHIAEVKTSTGDLTFEKVNNPSDEFWEFTHVTPEGEEVVVMTIQFYSDPVKFKELPIAQRKAKKSKKEGK